MRPESDETGTGNRGRLRQVVLLSALVAALAASARSTEVDSQKADRDQWPAYGGDPGGTRYSTLDQVTRENVEDLRVAWTYRTGELGQNAESGKSLTFE